MRVEVEVSERPWDESVVEGRGRARADAPERRPASDARVLSMWWIAAERDEQHFYRPPSVYLPAPPVFPNFEPDADSMTTATELSPSDSDAPVSEAVGILYERKKVSCLQYRCREHVA